MCEWMGMLGLRGKLLMAEGNSGGLLYAWEKKYFVFFPSKTSNPGIKEIAVKLP